MSQTFASFLSIRYQSAEWSVNMVILVPSRYGRNFSNVYTTAKNSFLVVVQFNWPSLSVQLKQQIMCCLLSICCPKTVSMVKSHMTSNGLNQSGAEILGSSIRIEKISSIPTWDQNHHIHRPFCTSIPNAKKRCEGLTHLLDPPPSRV